MCTVLSLQADQNSPLVLTISKRRETTVENAHARCPRHPLMGRVHGRAFMMHTEGKCIWKLSYYRRPVAARRRSARQGTTEKETSIETPLLYSWKPPQIRPHVHLDTEYVSNLNGPSAPCSGNGITHHRPSCHGDHALKSKVTLKT